MGSWVRGFIGPWVHGNFRWFARYRHVFPCGDEIPFEQDGWRDNVVWRGRMQRMVLHDLAVRGIEYQVVTGTVEEQSRRSELRWDTAGLKLRPSEALPHEPMNPWTYGPMNLPPIS
jgi:HTH-type transcriptional regulator, transcriptional repressor of NAD biosynthesis genes